MNNLVKFIVNGLPRSGTTAVRTAITKHADVFCKHEMLHAHTGARDPWVKPDQHKLDPLTTQQMKFILDELEQKIVGKNQDLVNKTHSKVIGFHYNYVPRSKRDSNVLVSGWVDKVIAVDRTDAFDRWKSGYLAWKHKQWHDWESGKSREQDNSILIDTHDFENIKRQVKANVDSRLEWLDWLEQFDDLIVIDYDEFCDNPVHELKRVQDFLNLPEMEITPAVNKFKKCTFVNEAELRDYVCDT